MKKPQNNETLLDYYLSLKYETEIVALPDGGYEAKIPELGKEVFRGYGETIQEAILNLYRVKRDVFERYINEGINIPEPRGKK